MCEAAGFRVHSGEHAAEIALVASRGPRRRAFSVFQRVTGTAPVRWSHAFAPGPMALGAGG